MKKVLIALTLTASTLFTATVPMMAFATEGPPPLPTSVQVAIADPIPPLSMQA